MEHERLVGLDKPSFYISNSSKIKIPATCQNSGHFDFTKYFLQIQKQKDLFIKNLTRTVVKLLSVLVRFFINKSIIHDYKNFKASEEIAWPHLVKVS